MARAIRKLVTDDSRGGPFHTINANGEDLTVLGMLKVLRRIILQEPHRVSCECRDNSWFNHLLQPIGPLVAVALRGLWYEANLPLKTQGARPGSSDSADACGEVRESSCAELLRQLFLERQPGWEDAAPVQGK
jgi:hypothetical protein